MSTDLDFGTGGIRALMGEGLDHINCHTIARITQGLANYLIKTYPQKLRVLIGFDARQNSRLFAEEAARVLAYQHIHVFLLEEIRPTPYISFASRHYECSSAIMITASHNPAEYNGYKVYGPDGGQLTAPHDAHVVQEVHAIDPSSSIEKAPFDSPFINQIGSSLDNEYLDAIYGLQLKATQNKIQGGLLHVVYTSLHGVGITLVPRALKTWGFSHLSLVEAQSIPDGTFPTVHFPNPEYPETLSMGITQLKSQNADLLIATDPDADRLGAAVMHKGTPQILSGNEMAALYLEYICHTRSPLPTNGAVIKTLVTTDLCKKIAKAHTLTCIEVLTGFKYIAEKIHLWETSSSEYSFILGAEESYGYLLGSYTRDKDGVSAACMLCEMALQAKLENKTLIDKLEDLYKTYGVYREKGLSLNFPEGLEGKEKIKMMMRTLRAHPPKTLCGHPITSYQDFLQGIDGLPTTDMLAFHCQDTIKLIIRPSGTEPKIKLYGSVCTPPTQKIAESIASCDLQLETLLQEISFYTQNDSKVCI